MRTRQTKSILRTFPRIHLSIVILVATPHSTSQVIVILLRTPDGMNPNEQQPPKKDVCDSDASGEVDFKDCPQNSFEYSNFSEDSELNYIGHLGIVISVRTPN